LNEQLEGSIALIDRRSAGTAIAPALNPMQELQARIIREGDIEKMKQLMELEKTWREDQAKQAFVEAMAAFKAESIRITKDKENKQYKSMYTTIGNLVDTVTPFLSRHGLSAGWEVSQDKAIRVTCTITHRLGHSKSVSMEGPADTSGAKNPLQQIKSTVTYLKIGTFEAICGLASVEGNLDDDGNGSGKRDEPTESMEGAAVNDFISLIEGSGDLDELQKNYFNARDVATKIGDKHALNAFAEAKNKQYLKLTRRAK
jgi:hypothetical protein